MSKRFEVDVIHALADHLDSHGFLTEPMEGSGHGLTMRVIQPKIAHGHMVMTLTDGIVILRRWTRDGRIASTRLELITPSLLERIVGWFSMSI